MKIKLLIVAACTLLIYQAKADEGMWLMQNISQKNIEKMKKLGSNLNSEDIYSTQKKSIKDAVIALDGGSCTGEIVSNQGMFFTNHHCAFDDVKKLSSVDKDYLKDGFWSYSKDKEMPIKGKTITFLEKAEDVTSIILPMIEEAIKKGDNKGFWKRRVFKEALKVINKDKKYGDVEINEFFSSQKFYAYYYKIYKDIRLVAAPPVSIAAFGQDSDNWMWPQHKTDFSIYRIYADKDGNPAEYSESNVPLNTEKFFKINAKGIKEGDFTMVVGYPYTNDRFATSFEVEQKINEVNPAMIDARGAKLKVLEKEMPKSDTVRIMYASQYFNLANYYKYAKGEIFYIKNQNVIEKKQKLEKEVKEWIKQDPTRIAEYGNVVDTLEAKYTSRKGKIYNNTLYKEGILIASKLLANAMSYRPIYNSLKEENGKKKEADVKKKIESSLHQIRNRFKDFDINVDKKIFSDLISIYTKKADSKYQSETLINLLKKFSYDYDKLTDYIYGQTIFLDSNKVKKLLTNPEVKIFEKDFAFKILAEISEKMESDKEFLSDLRAEIAPFERKYVKAVMEYKKDEDFYPSANSTMRLSFGKVQTFSPKDGLIYRYYTTSNGYLAKEIPGDPEFDIKPDYKKLLQVGNFAPYFEGRNATIDFISDNDITGGNSGSPVIDGNGDIIGLAFDGNWESLAGTYYFSPDYNKCINVDIRFVLFVIEKYGKAKNIIDELTIIK